MRGVNHVVIGGNLGRDPESKMIADGKKVVTFSLALSRKFKGRNGTDEESVTWIKVVCFQDLAEICEKNLSKGDQVLVYGWLNIREWEDRQTGEKRRVAEIQAREVNFLSVKKWKEQGRNDEQGS